LNDSKPEFQEKSLIDMCRMVIFEFIKAQSA